ncbi:hypothetical protein C5695_05515 [Bacillus pumilus]|uniref:Uncharacterized protein n=1 Tax=Bacillus pumilus TaxID=1408 RepID=A0AAD0HLS2_BACPU|nr:hypothetical protein C5695_05515 [Bacillus pumilus]
MILNFANGLQFAGELREIEKKQKLHGKVFGWKQGSALGLLGRLKNCWERFLLGRKLKLMERNLF